MKFVTFTIPYFRVTDQPPAPDYAPFSSSGIFSIDATGGQYIREQKFSLVRSGAMDKPFLMLALSPLCQVRGLMGYVQDEYTLQPIGFWIEENLNRIISEWETVLDSLDEQTTLPV